MSHNDYRTVLHEAHVLAHGHKYIRLVEPFPIDTRAS